MDHHAAEKAMQNPTEDPARQVDTGRAALTAGDSPSSSEGLRSSEAFLAAVEAGEPSLIREFIDFLRDNKKWWLTPIILAIFLLMFLVVLSMSPAAPFIYTLF